MNRKAETAAVDFKLLIFQVNSVFPDLLRSCFIKSGMEEQKNEKYCKTLNFYFHSDFLQTNVCIFPVIFLQLQLPECKV